MKQALLILSLCLLSRAQEQPKILTPDKLETAELGKIKGEVTNYNIQLKLIESQKNALDLEKQIVQERGQAKYSELLSKAESVKQAHGKDWGSADQISFDPMKGEAGSFTLNPKKEDKSAKQKDANEKEKEGKKIKN